MTGMRLAVQNTAAVQPFGKVIAGYRKQKGMNQAELAEALDVTRLTIINWENGKRKPDIDAVRNLCIVLEIPPLELLGIPNAAQPTANESALLKCYRQLTIAGKRILNRTLRAMLDEEKEIRIEKLRGQFRILAGEATAAAAGPGCVFLDQAAEPVFIRRSALADRADAVVRVYGRSMEPYYHDGAYVLVRYGENATEGDDVVCSTVDGAVIKRIRDSKLHSLNAELPFGEHYEDDNVHIAGVVVGILEEADFPTEEEKTALQELMSAELKQFKKQQMQKKEE